MKTKKEAARHYAPVPQVTHTWGTCKTKGCYARGDLGDGICVNCWDRKRDNPEKKDETQLEYKGEQNE